MKNINVAFFGTSDRSIPILGALKRNFKMSLCVTKQDSLYGRHQELKETAVKSWCTQNKINFIEVENLKSPDLDKVIESLETNKIEYIIVADFSLIIPHKLLEMYPKKIVNIHFSLLPNYRGASPVQFAILKGDEISGVTFHLINDRMDSGKILKQIGYTMPKDKTSGEIYEELFEITAQKLPEILNEYIQHKLTPLPQEETAASYTFSPSHPNSTFIYKEDARINWKSPDAEIYRQIRAFNPWPISWTYLKDMKFKFKKHVDTELKAKIYSADLVEDELQIKEIQVAGRNKIYWQEFKNGYLEL